MAGILSGEWGKCVAYNYNYYDGTLALIYKYPSYDGGSKVSKWAQRFPMERTGSDDLIANCWRWGPSYFLKWMPLRGPKTHFGYHSAWADIYSRTAIKKLSWTTICLSNIHFCTRKSTFWPQFDSDGEMKWWTRCTVFVNYQILVNNNPPQLLLFRWVWERWTNH